MTVCVRLALRLPGGETPLVLGRHLPALLLGRDLSLP